MTKTYCELLYVEADNIRKIYEVSLFLLLSPFHLLYLSQTHKDVMENLLHPRGGKCSGNVATDDPHCPPGVGAEEVDGEEGGVFPQSELALAGATVHEIITSHYPNLLS